MGTGLLLGGGLSFLSAEHGFSADAFKELDVVLVNGDMVTATATNEYADLFRALKGGANRFGIVTRYEVEAVHTGTKDDKTWFGGAISVSENYLRREIFNDILTVGYLVRRACPRSDCSLCTRCERSQGWYVRLHRVCVPLIEFLP